MNETATWLQEMSADVQLSIAREAQYWETAFAAVSEAKRRMGELGVAADNHSAARQVAVEQDLAKEAEAKLSAGRFQELSRRELRVGIRRFQSVSPQTYRRLLASRPDALAELVDAYFEKWTTLARLGRLEELAQLLQNAPPGVRVLHRGLPARHLLGPKAPESVAHRQWPSLASLITYLSQELRCRAYWEFFREVLAEWIVFANGSQDVTRIWSEMAANRHVSEALLPELSNESWFDGRGIGKAGVAALPTQARVIASVLRACLSTQGDLQDSIVERMLRSSLRDPRVPPLSQGWDEVKAVDAALFDWFLESLIKADLSLFFRYAMDEEDREHFWLRYLKQIRGTLVVLSRDRFSEIQRRIGAEEAGQAMLRRARKAQSSGVSAFCLFFDRIVAVEFSQTGNAAYLYPREQFTTLVLPHLNPVRSVTDDLKRRDLQTERLAHNTGWQGVAIEILRRYGIR